jgi:hypothetical protein
LSALCAGEHASLSSCGIRITTRSRDEALARAHASRGGCSHAAAMLSFCVQLRVVAASSRACAADANGGCSSGVERLTVAQEVAGSKPVTHPTTRTIPGIYDAIRWGRSRASLQRHTRRRYHCTGLLGRTRTDGLWSDSATSTPPPSSRSGCGRGPTEPR